MHINLYLIPFVIISGLILDNTDSNRKRLVYIVLCISVLIFIASMRNPEWMTYTYSLDTLNYKWMFEDSFEMSWKEFSSLVYDRYWNNEGENDIGFLALNKTISLFTHKFHYYSLVANLIFFVPFGVLLYRYCSSIRQIMFAFVFYIAMIQVFLFGGARQIFALGFDMIAFITIIKRKKVLSTIFFILGVSVHFSSFLFMLPLLMIWHGIKPNNLKLIHFICFLSFPIVLLFPNELIVFMGETIGIEKYANYGKNEIQGGATTFIILIELLSLFCLIAIDKKDLSKYKSLSYFYVMAPLFTLFAPLIVSNGNMIRVSLYYHLFLVFLVPFSIDAFFKSSDKMIAYIATIGSLAFLATLGGGMEYYFFWDSILY